MASPFAATSGYLQADKGLIFMNPSYNLIKTLSYELDG
jgi:hypothetical protein